MVVESEFTISVESGEGDEYGLDLKVCEWAIGYFFVFEESGKGF